MKACSLKTSARRRTGALGVSMMRAALSVCAILGCVSAAYAGAELVLGVHPYKPASQLITAYAPLARHLGEKLGQPVAVRISKDYQAHIDAVGRDAYDFAYIAPLSYVKMTEQYGPMPLLARQAIDGNTTFHGKIIVRKDGSIQTLADLKGKRFAFVEPESTMGYLVPRQMLKEQGVTLQQLARRRFLGDHANVALAVLTGDDEAGAVKEDVFFEYEKRGLRAIATSPPFSDHLFVASRKLPAATVQAARGALLHLADTLGGKGILQSMTRGVTALAPVSDRDYDTLRTVIRSLGAGE
jgi:phosphonate transport system substrate-binding protein